MQVKLCPDGNAGLNAFRRDPYDVCLLDVMLPQKDGFTLAREIRALNQHTPLIFLTARSLKEDKLLGFSLGADDYITKPFDEQELVCRIHAVLKRTQPAGPLPPVTGPVALGQYRFDPSNQTLLLGSRTKRLTERENELLKLLCQSRGQLVRRDDVLRTLWGQTDYFSGRSLDVFITKLRKYLADDPAVQIETLHRVGFILTVG
ncbi:MAG: Transcriptional regulatory protein rprY [uncultured Cytophagales bacterium]|uniref:Transcriptional regulatory protein rprY n=1 Tax=uncultured Cytophagales bacterium TaxID=158755 RepID=A0A6J4JJJ2_9SPHI|nr:MAG: Transcriptional regulatory protein rprY [uncultured Cytophagales bacterium]